MLTTLRRQLSRVRALVCRSRLDQDFDDEMAAHLAMAVDDYVKRGLSLEQARRAAVLRLGNRASLMEQQRELQRLPLIETGLARPAPGRPHAQACAGLCGHYDSDPRSRDRGQYRDLQHLQRLADRAAALSGRHRLGSRDSGTGSQGRGHRGRDAGGFVDWRQRTRAFAHLAALSPYPHFNLTTGGEPERLSGAAVSADFFELLGTELTLGRSFSCGPGTAGTRRRGGVELRTVAAAIHADRTIVGRAIALSGTPHVVIGVLPAHFRFIAQRSDINSRRGFDVWVPLASIDCCPNFAKRIRCASSDGSPRR